MPVFNRLFILSVLLIIYACSSSDELTIDYNDPETTIDAAAQYAQTMYDQEKYNDAEDAYNWIRSRDSLNFQSTYLLKLIDVYGAQGRYEKQLEEYNKIFTSDSVDNTAFVPHFYRQIGLSYYERSKIPTPSGDIDSSLIKLAVDNFIKCYAYTLHRDLELQADARYHAGLSYSRLGQYDKSRQQYQFIVDSLRGTAVHQLAFFRRDRVEDISEFEITQDMQRRYEEAYQFVKRQDDLNALRQKSEELSRQDGEEAKEDDDDGDDEEKPDEDEEKDDEEKDDDDEEKEDDDEEDDDENDEEDDEN